MAEIIIGRESETAILKEIYASSDAELVAIYGRRRVGKTFLIRNMFEKQLAFECAGIHNATIEQQLENFTLALMSVSASQFRIERPANWLAAFQLLTDYLTPLVKKERRVIFFDEFPWLSTHKSGFMQAFEHFWNSWGARQKNLVVVICGSAAAWMIKKVINNRGGLHNRVTRRLRLLPFTVKEVGIYLKSRKIVLDRYQVLQLYMVTGGIPQYLKEVKKGESVANAVDRICFTKDGLLHDEFNNLYTSLFEDAGRHMEVVRALAKKQKGLTRNEIILACKFSSGGGVTQLLEELTESGFISAYIPFDRNSKDIIYKLTDEYSHFYLKFIEHNKGEGPGTWIRLARETTWKSWSSLAFENICMKHVPLLKKALGIEGVYTTSSGWRYSGSDSESGVQIDLLIDRQDLCINICEIKFSQQEFVITKSYAAALEEKMNIFQERTKTKKTLFLTMITTFGVRSNEYKSRMVQSEVTMDALFD